MTVCQYVISTVKYEDVHMQSVLISYTLCIVQMTVNFCLSIR